MPATRLYPEPTRSSPSPQYLFLKIHLNIILPPTPGSPKWSLSLRLLQQKHVYDSPLPHTSYMPSSSHFSRLYHPNVIGWGVHIVKLLIMYFSPLPYHLGLLRPKYSQHLILQHPQLRFLPHCQRTSATVKTLWDYWQGQVFWGHFYQSRLIDMPMKPDRRPLPSIVFWRRFYPHHVPILGPALSPISHTASMRLWASAHRYEQSLE
jgi:hypothetical protein